MPHNTDQHHSSQGKYAKLIEGLSENGYGNLRYLDEFMKSQVAHHAKFTVMNFTPSSRLESVHGSEEAKAHNNHMGKCRSLFIVEDLSRDVIEELGTTFTIEPQFFAEHLRDVDWSHHTDKSNAAMLPSVRNFARYWILRHFEPIVMQSQQPYPASRYHLDMNVLRGIDFRPSQNDSSGSVSIGFVRRIVSFWYRKHSNGCFEAIALVDPPLSNPLRFYSQELKNGRWFQYQVPGKNLWTPFGGGYVDFARLRREHDFLGIHHPSRSAGTSNDLQLRMRDCANPSSPFLLQEDDPVNAAIQILQNIVLSNWTLTMSFFQRDFNSLPFEPCEESSPDTLAAAEQALRESMASRDILRKSMGMISSATRQLFTGMNAHDAMGDEIILDRDWTSLIEEFQSLATDTEVLSGQWQQHQAKLQEVGTRASKALTALGSGVVMIFTPLGCAYGILSMGGEFAPGNRKFWIFFVVGSGLILLTMCCFWAYAQIESRRSNRARRVGFDEERGLFNKWRNRSKE